MTKYEMIDAMLNVSSIAVVGASNNPAKWGYEVMDFLTQGDYQGKIYPVNPKEDTVWGMKSYASLQDIPDKVDMVDICIPSPFVNNVIKQAIAKKSKFCVLFSAGFRESGNHHLEEEILETIRDTDFRIIGPNVQGIVNPKNKMCNMAEPLLIKEGPVGIVSQSGSVSAAIGEWLQNDEVGLSALINLGNQIDLDESDFIEYFSLDHETKVIALYLEGPKDNEKFKNTLEKYGKEKPIVVMKPGKTDKGMEAAASHTGSIAGNDEIFSHACKQYNVMRVPNMTSYYDTIRGFATSQLPMGKRVFVLTTSGGMGSVLTDELYENDLELVDFPHDVLDDLKTEIDLPGTNVGNVMDLMVPVDPWEKAIKAINQKYENYFDVYFFMIADMLRDVEYLIEDLAKKTDKTIIVTYMSGSEPEKKTREYLQKIGIQVYPTPDRAVAALKNMVWYAERKSNGEEI